MVLQAIVVSIYELTKFNARTGLPLLEPFNKNIPFAGFIPPPTAAGIYPEKNGIISAITPISVVTNIYMLV